MKKILTLLSILFSTTLMSQHHNGTGIRYNGGIQTNHVYNTSNYNGSSWNRVNNTHINISHVNTSHSIRYPSRYHRFTPIRFMGVGYFYYGGFFYDSWYNLIIPPYGMIITMLPNNCEYITDNVYGISYYNYGIYYTKNDSGYVTVKPQIGTIVSTLPKNVKIVVINNQTYYVVGDIYYQTTIIDNQTKYIVVSK